MSDMAASNFVRADLVGERAAPEKTSSLFGVMRTRLFSSPGNILLTIVGALLIWFTVVPSLKFLLVDAVWLGHDRDACLENNAGHVVGACWPFITAKFYQLMYGFYPEPERWRVKLTFLLAALLLVPLLIPRLPAKNVNAGLFFVAFPVVAFFLLRGGGLGGFAISWIASLLSGFADSFASAGNALVRVGDTTAVIGVLPWLLGKIVVLIGLAISVAVWPLVWLRDQMQNLGQPVWADVALTTIMVSALVFYLAGGVRTGWRGLFTSLAIFSGIAIVMAAMGLDRGGLPVVDTQLWGGVLVTLVISITGIVTSLPIGIALALGRRSTIPLIRLFCIGFIEFWRGVPLITILFFATYMLPLFLPGNFSVNGLVRALIGTALFAGAYQAEVVRGGLQAIPRGQIDAAEALGLSWWKTTSLIVLPQALRHVIPAIVNLFIGLFKDTSLVSIVALFDLLGSLRAAFADPNWSSPTTLFTGFAFTGIIYFAFCFGMSRYSLFVEHRLNAHRRN
jgi:general L-amino acid transport system permease protein